MTQQDLACDVFVCAWMCLWRFGSGGRDGGLWQLHHHGDGHYHVGRTLMLEWVQHWQQKGATWQQQNPLGHSANVWLYMKLGTLKMSFAANFTVLTVYKGSDPDALNHKIHVHTQIISYVLRVALLWRRGSSKTNETAAEMAPPPSSLPEETSVLWGDDLTVWVRQNTLGTLVAAQTGCAVKTLELAVVYDLSNMQWFFSPSQRCNESACMWCCWVYSISFMASLHT